MNKTQQKCSGTLSPKWIHLFIIFNLMISSSHQAYAVLPTLAGKMHISKPVITKVYDLAEKYKPLEKAMEGFEEHCIDEKGEIRRGTIVVTKNSITKDEESINCELEAKHLGHIAQKAHNDIKTHEKKPEKENPKEMTLEECAILKQAESEMPLHGGGKKLINNVEKIVQQCKEETKNCSVDFSKNTLQKCAKDIGCNLLRTTSFVQMLNLIPHLKNSTVNNSCLAITQPSCATEIIQGIIADISANAAGLLHLAKVVGTGIKDSAISTWNSFTKVEDKTSQAALLASRQNDADLKEAEKDRPNFIFRISNGIFHFLANAIKENFSCKKWSGVPHHSKCLEELASFSCATCDQWTNMICGTLGALGGEVLSAYLAAGVFHVSEKMAVAASSAVKTVLISKVPGAAEVADKMTLAMSATKIASAQAINAALKIVNSPLSQKLIAFSKELPLSKAAIKLAKSKPIQIIISGVSKINYFKYLDEAYETGLHDSDLVMRLGHRSFKAALYDKAILKSDNLPALASKLKSQQIEFDSITLPDGSQALQIIKRK